MILITYLRRIQKKKSREVKHYDAYNARSFVIYHHHQQDSRLEIFSLLCVLIHTLHETELPVFPYSNFIKKIQQKSEGKLSKSLCLTIPYTLSTNGVLLIGKKSSYLGQLYLHTIEDRKEQQLLAMSQNFIHCIWSLRCFHF